MKERIPLPSKIQNAPVLLPGLELYYIAFNDLMASRMTGFGMGPLWWSTIQQYCDHHGIVGMQAEDMQYHLRELDAVYLTHVNKK
jgi:hypothetical protein